MKRKELIRIAKMCKESIIEHTADVITHECSDDCPYFNGTAGCIERLVEDLAKELEKDTIPVGNGENYEVVQK